MAGFWDAITGVFGGGNKVRIVPLYSMRHDLMNWRDSGHFPSYYELPPGISFDTHFWERVKEIHRHTTSDKHERAISVWWVDDEFVLTEQVRGSDTRVNIPAQRVSVSYKPIPGTDGGERIVTVDGKVVRKKTVSIETIKNLSGKKLEVSHLFHMHTHPPPRHHTAVSAGTDRNSVYSFFSHTDISSFITSKAAFSGLVTDRLWLIARTSETPSAYSGDDSASLTAEILTDMYKIKVYQAEFGRSAIVVRPEIKEGGNEDSLV